MTQHEIQHFFDQLPHLKLVVIGDVMVDAYAWGYSDRMSPEAPVPVVQIKRTENRAGGAANVALNLAAMGVQVTLVSLVGNDAAGRELEQLLHSEGVSTHGLVGTAERPTTIKTRIMSGNRQLLRIDDESTSDASEQESKALLSAFTSALSGAHAVIFQDYDKGVLHAANIDVLMALCKQRGIPTAIDPKKKNFFSYEGSSLFKPNLKELGDAFGWSLHKDDMIGIEKAVKQLESRLQPEAVLLTLSEAGVLYSSFNEKGHLPAHVRSIADVSGAGDTVIAVAGCALAARLPLNTLASLANLAGGLVCEHLGVVPIKSDKLLAEALKNAE
ncbi:MAG: D-glycero-beta-D-manno-heptose-7-phosphate kinase [Sphingobacteriaceae bacterium]|nr:D-glycero-beta-D-manno-heptose-7-phosphate kinase [Sphingobacteriaceae bacterium]